MGDIKVEYGTYYLFEDSDYNVVLINSEGQTLDRAIAIAQNAGVTRGEYSDGWDEDTKQTGTGWAWSLNGIVGHDLSYERIEALKCAWLKNEELAPAEWYDYVIPGWAICVIEYGDYSGLSDGDIERVNRFIESLPGPGVFGYAEEPYFSHSNDLHNLGDSVVDAIYVVIR